MSKIDRVIRRNKRRRETAKRKNNNCWCGYGSDDVKEFNQHKHLITKEEYFKKYNKLFV